MKKSTKVGVVIWGVILIVAVWMVSNEVEEGRERSIIEHAETAEDVKDFYYGQIPGLKRAEQLGLTRDYEGIQLNVNNRRVNINQIWYSSENVYILYSMNRLQEEHPPYLRGEIAGQNGNEQYGQTTLFPIHTIQFQNQFYNFMKFPPLPSQEKDQLVNKIDQLILKDLSIHYFKGENEQVYNLQQPIKLNVGYNANNKVKKTIPLNKTIEIMDHQLRLKKLIVGVAKNTLYIEHLTPNKGTLFDIKVSIKNHVNEKDRTQFPKDIGINQYTIKFQPFNEFPKKLTFTISELFYIENQSVSAKIDLSKLNLNQEEITLNQKLGSLYDNTIILNRLLVDNDLVEIELIREQNKKEEPIKQIFLRSPVLANSTLLQEFGPFPNLVTVKNEKGEQLPHISGTFQQGDGSAMAFGISKEFINRSDKLIFEMENIPIQIKGEWTVSINNIRKK